MDINVTNVNNTFKIPTGVYSDARGNKLLNATAQTLISEGSATLIGDQPYQPYVPKTVTSNTDASGNASALNQNGIPIDLSGSVSGGVMFSSPSINHGSSLGYALSDHWLNKTNGKLYQNLRNTDGSAVWKLVPEQSPYLVDAVGVAAAACYGVKKLRKAYAGACFQITRADTTKLDIGFVSDGNGGEIVDWAAADAFIAGTTGRITTWYDQSGNALNGTQATAANGFSWSPIQLQENPRGLVGDSYAVSHWLDVPSTLNTVNRTNHTMYVIGTPISAGVPSTFFELLSCSLIGQTAPVISANVGPNIVSTLTPHTGPCASVYELYCGSTTSLTLSIDDKSYIYTGAITNTVSAGAVIGSSNTHSSRYTGTMHGVVVFATALTTAQRTIFKQQAYRAFGIAPQLRNSLVFEGDSLRNGGILGTSMAPVPSLLSKFHYQNKRIYNIGVSGKTAAQMLTNASWTASIAANNVNNHVDIWAGTNDAAASVDAVTISQTLASLIAVKKTQGYLKVNMCTAIGRSGVAGPIIAQLNPLIRSGLGQDTTTDYGADASIGEGKQTDLTYFQADQIHLNDNGQAVADAPTEQTWKYII